MKKNKFLLLLPLCASLLGGCDLSMLIGGGGSNPQSQYYIKLYDHELRLEIGQYYHLQYEYVLPTPLDMYYWFTGDDICTYDSYYSEIQPHFVGTTIFYMSDINNRKIYDTCKITVYDPDDPTAGPNIDLKDECESYFAKLGYEFDSTLSNSVKPRGVISHGGYNDGNFYTYEVIFHDVTSINGQKSQFTRAGYIQLESHTKDSIEFLDPTGYIVVLIEDVSTDNKNTYIKLNYCVFVNYLIHINKSMTPNDMMVALVQKHKCESYCLTSISYYIYLDNISGNLQDVEQYATTHINNTDCYFYDINWSEGMIDLDFDNVAETACVYRRFTNSGGNMLQYTIIPHGTSIFDIVIWVYK